MRERSLTEIFLSEVAGTLEVFSKEQYPPLFNPSLAVACSLVLACSVSFSKELLTPLTAVIISVVLLVAFKGDVSLWLRPVLFTLFVASLVSVPLLFIREGKPLAEVRLGSFSLYVTAPGLEEAALLVLRTVSAAAIFSAVLVHIGWRGVIDGLRGLRVPQELILMTGFVMKYVPVFLRDVCRTLAAREARILKKPSYLESWGLLSTVVGDIIVKGYWRAFRVEMALKARGFEGHFSASNSTPQKVGINDIALLVATVVVVLSTAVGV